MSTATDTHASPSVHPPSPGRTGSGRIRTLVGLGAALTAGLALLLVSPADHTPPPAGRTTAATAWPHGQRADIPGNLPDGPVFDPKIFLDARTSIGTAATPDGESLRLVFRGGDGTLRELRRMPIEDNAQFYGFTVAGDELAWAESTEKTRARMWAVNLRDGAPARRLTSDTGSALFYDSQYDTVIADGRLYWTAAGPDPEKATEIRSVALAGGPVQVNTEPGTWALSAWPWLVNGFADQTGTTRLRNMATHRDIAVNSSGVELTTCSPTWCRVMVMSGGGLARIDLMHPDGTARRRIAGSAGTAAITDVAPLDRFEVLAEAGPNSDLTGTEQLLVYEIASRRTVDIDAEASAVFCRNGVLWWSTGNRDDTVWHTIDLRTA
jgi:hypothetical protein